MKWEEGRDGAYSLSRGRGLFDLLQACFLLHSVTQLSAAMFSPVLAFWVDERIRWHNQGKDGGRGKSFWKQKLFTKSVNLSLRR